MRREKTEVNNGEEREVGQKRVKRNVEITENGERGNEGEGKLHKRRGRKRVLGRREKGEKKS